MSQLPVHCVDSNNGSDDWANRLSENGFSCQKEVRVTFAKWTVALSELDHLFKNLKTLFSDWDVF